MKWTAKNPAALTAGLTIETLEEETINMSTVAVTEGPMSIPAELASWSWDEGCDRSYVHLIGGTASVAVDRGKFAVVELAYVPNDDPTGDGLMVAVDMPASGSRSGQWLYVTAAEARALANGIGAVLALVPEKL